MDVTFQEKLVWKRRFKL